MDLKGFNLFHTSLEDAITDSLMNFKPMFIYVCHKRENDLAKYFNSMMDRTDTYDFYKKFVMLKLNLADDEFQAEIDTASNTYPVFQLFLNNLDKTQSALCFLHVNIDEHLYFVQQIENEECLLIVIHEFYKVLETAKKDMMVKVQISATKQVGEFIKNCYEVPCANKSLDDAINEYLIVQPEYVRKVFILYYHVPSGDLSYLLQLYSMFYKKFPEYCDNLIYLLPWDLSDSDRNNDLKDVIGNNFHYDILETSLNSETSQMFIFISSENEPCLYSKIDDEITFDLFENIIMSALESHIINNNITDLAELDAINNFIRKNPSFKKYGIRKVPLRIQPVQENSILLLYFYQYNCDLHNGIREAFDEKEIFRQSFNFVPWDINMDNNANKLLELSLRRNFNLSSVVEIFQSRKNSLLIFQPFVKLYKQIECVKENVETNLKRSLQVRTIMSNTFKTSFLVAQIFQQMLCDKLSDRDYDHFFVDFQRELLVDKISFAACENTDIDVQKLTDKIILLTKEHGSNPNEVFLSFIFVCIINTNVVLYPVFVLKKRDGSRLFIDHILRTYNTWEHFLETNKYPEHILVAPRNGKYTVNWEQKVMLDYTFTSLISNLLSNLDMRMIGLGIITALIAPLAAVPAITLAPAIITGATVAGASVTGYGVCRSISSLYDKKTHNMSISIENSEARADYLNILTGIFSVGKHAVTYCAKKGIAVGKVAKRVQNGVNATNLIISGVAMTNSLKVIMTNLFENEPVSTKTLLQLTSNILFFGHSYYNSTGTGNVANDVRNKILCELKDLLQINIRRKLLKALTSSEKNPTEKVSYIKNLHIDQNNMLTVISQAENYFIRNGIHLCVKGKNIYLDNVATNISKFNDFSKLQTSRNLCEILACLKMEDIHQKISISRKIYERYVTNFVLDKKYKKITARDTISLIICGFTEITQEIILKYINQLSKHVFTHLSQSAINNILPKPTGILVNLTYVVIGFFFFLKNNTISGDVRTRIENALILSQLDTTLTLEKMFSYFNEWLVEKTYETYQVEQGKLKL